MTKMTTLVAVLGLTIGGMLAMPSASEAGPLRDRFAYILSQRGSPDYYSASPDYNSGQWASPDYNAGQRGGFLRNYFSNYYRVGNVIINGNRWGDLGYQMDHSDLIRW